MAEIRLRHFYREKTMRKFSSHVAGKAGVPFSIGIGEPVMVPEKAAKDIYAVAYEHATHPGVVSEGKRWPLVSELGFHLDEGRGTAVFSTEQVDTVKRAFKHLEQFHEAHPPLISELFKHRLSSKQAERVIAEAKKLLIAFVEKGIVDRETRLPQDMAGFNQFFSDLSKRTEISPEELALLKSVRKGMMNLKPTDEKTARYLAALAAIHNAQPRPGFGFIEFSTVPAGAEKINAHFHPAYGHPAAAAPSEGDIRILLKDAAEEF